MKVIGKYKTTNYLKKNVFFYQLIMILPEATRKLLKPLNTMYVMLLHSFF